MESWSGRVLIGRIRSRTDDVLGKEQCGFRSGRGSVDQLFVASSCVNNFGKGKVFSGPFGT